MSIADKQVLLNRIAAELGSDLTASQVTKAMSMLTMSMEEFEVSYTGSAHNGGNELLDAFLSTKKIEGRSPKTIERYRYILTKMLDGVAVPISSINVYHLRAYLAEKKSRGLSDRTLEGERSVFCSFFGWLNREGLLPLNPAGNLAAINSRKKVRTPLSDTDVEKLKEVCETDRDKALIAFLLSSGCRISEVCSLNRGDVDFAGMKCTVLGKGDKERVVFLDSVAVMFLRRYLDGRTDEHEALFAGRGTARMTPGGVRFMLKKLAGKAAVENVHPHRFRRTLATNLIDRGMPIQEVASVLGHERIDTTMRYVYVSEDNVQNSYRKYS